MSSGSPLAREKAQAHSTAESAPLYGLRAVVERIEERPVCGMRPDDWPWPGC
jgi:hypothetical protein